jgi:hypothetical protein
MVGVIPIPFRESRNCSLVAIVVVRSASSVFTLRTSWTPPFRSSPSFSCLAFRNAGHGQWYVSASIG